MPGIDERRAAPAPMGRLAGRPVRRVGYGMRRLVGPEAPGREAAVALLRRAVELGVDHIDTAGWFGDGTADGLIRAALHPYPDDLMVVSKVGVAYDEQDGLRPAQRPEELRAAVEAGLRRLGTERLDAVYLRRVDSGPRLVATGDQRVDLDLQLAELASLRDQGKVGGIGLSNVDLHQLRQALPAGIVAVQNVYSLVERKAEPLLEECRRHGAAWVPFFLLGEPAAPVPAEHPAVVAAAAALGASATQVALAWLLGHDSSILCVPGTTSAAHLEEDVAATGVRLDAETTAVLDGIAGAAVPPGPERSAGR